METRERIQSDPGSGDQEMTRRALTTAAILLGRAGPRRAAPANTKHQTVTKADAPPAPANPLVANAAKLAKSPLPDGPADIVFVIGDRGARAEFRQAANGFAAGTVTITKPNGDMFVLDPKSKTYWKVVINADPAAGQQALNDLKAAGMTPRSETSTKRTGEFSDVAGVRCERVIFDFKLIMPMPDFPPEVLAELPAELRQPITMTQRTELWMATDRFKDYAIASAKRMAAGMKEAREVVTMMGMDKMPSDGLVMRQIERNPDLGYSLESVVTAIHERDAPASLFEIPSDYKEVPAPKIGPGRP
jgi:hypothetical protein